MGFSIIIIGIFAFFCTVVNVAHSRPMDVMYVDMSYHYDSDTIFWPTMPRFKLEKLFEVDTNETWFRANAFCASEHGGTHIDAPIHFGRNKLTVDQLAMDKLVGPAAVINITEKAMKNSDATVSLDDVMAYEKKHGEIPRGAFVFMLSGWGKRWPNPVTYLGNDKNDTANFHYPSWSSEAIEFLIKERQIIGAGVDTASTDPAQRDEPKVHRLLGEQNLVGLENVANLDKLPVSGATVYALPLKIKGGSGGPTRVFGVVPK